MSLKSYIKKGLLYKCYKHIFYSRHIRNKKIATEYFWKENVELLTKFANALNQKNIVFWLEFGSLLGYYREHDFIPHDCDIDVGTFYKNHDEVKFALEQNGFERVRYYFIEGEEGIEECYRYKHTTIDVFYFRDDNDKRFCNSFLPIYDMSKKKYLNKKCPCRVKRIDVPKTDYVRATFKGIPLYVPKDIVLYLETHYGPTFMTPNPQYNSKKDSTNIKYYTYEEKKGCCIMKIGYY